MSLTIYKCPGCRRRHYGRTYWSNKPPPDHICEDCHNAGKPEEYESTHGLRCPMCGELEQDDLCEIQGIYCEGTTQASCPSCSFDYEVETDVTIEWKSPERIKLHHGHTGIPCELDDNAEWMPLSEREHRFQCIGCERWCCACFGSGSDVDAQQSSGEGICCDCHVAMEKGEMSFEPNDSGKTGKSDKG